MFDAKVFSERLVEASFEADVDSGALAMACGVAVQSVNRWKRGEQLPYLSYLIKIVDTLNCSIEFLVGRTPKLLDFSTKKAPNFYEHLISLLKTKSISRYKLMKMTSIKDSHLSNWKKGASPQLPTLLELADFLELSIDQLVGREV